MTDDNDNVESVEDDEFIFGSGEDEEEEDTTNDPFEEPDVSVVETDEPTWDDTSESTETDTVVDEEPDEEFGEPELEPLSPRRDLFEIRRYDTSKRSTSDEMLRIEVNTDDFGDPDTAFAPIRKRGVSDNGVPTREIVEITSEVYYDLDGIDIDMLEEAIEEFFFEEGKSKGNFEIFHNF